MNRSTLGKVGKLVVALLAAAPIVTFCPVALSNGKHAALAYSDARHVYGFAKDQASQEEAASIALGSCGEDCTVRLHWEGGCGVYAQGEDNVHGWTVAPSKAEAERRAVAACAKHGGTRCTVREWGCQ